MHAKQDHWSQGYKASLCSLFFSKQIKVSIEVSVELVVLVNKHQLLCIQCNSTKTEVNTRNTFVKYMWIPLCHCNMIREYKLVLKV